MKAAIFEQPGPPEQVLFIRDIPVPQPGFGEVRVRMLTSPINPSDLMFIQGVYSVKPTLPAVPGFEGVGVVEESGGGLIGRYLTGKRVVVLNDRHGNWAEKTVASAKQCIPVPSDFSNEQAATFFVNPATALAITRSILSVPSGEWLLQSAAGSALGKMVIRIGKLFGFRTINIVRRREQIEELKAIGATEVIVESDGNIPDQVRSLTNGQGVRFAMDPVGGSTGSAVVQSLSVGGHAVLYGLLSGESITVDPRFLITGSKKVSGFWLGDWIKKKSLIQKLRFIRRIRSLIRAGVLTSEIASTFALEEVHIAVNRAAAMAKGGKVLLSIGSTP